MLVLLPQYLSQDLEKLQRRAVRIIYPGLWYPEALSEAGIVTLFDRREFLLISRLMTL